MTGSDYGAIAESFIGSLPTDSMGGGYNYNNCPWMRTKSGFGLVNARKSVEVARSGNVISISKYTGTSVSAPTKQFTKTVTVPSGKKLRASFSPNVLPPNGSIPIEYSLDEFGIKNAKSGIYNSRTTAGWTMAGEMNSATSSSQDYVLCGTQRKGSAAGYMTWRFI